MIIRRKKIIFRKGEKYFIVTNLIDNKSLLFLITKNRSNRMINNNEKCNYDPQKQQKKNFKLPIVEFSNI